MVEAVDVHTVGLGGDSQVTISDEHSRRHQGLNIGPRRVVPLCLLASQHPQIVSQLKAQLVENRKDSLAGQFIVSNRRTGRQIAVRDLELLEQLEAGPRSIIDLAQITGRPRYLLLRQLERLAAERLVLPAGFTPTDALHVLGLFERWDPSAAMLGAELLAARDSQAAEALCQTVIDRVSDQVATELVSKVLADETVRPNWAREPTAMAMLARALGRVTDSGLDCRLGLNQPIAGIGAPVLAYLPRTARQLRTDLVTPDHAGVANAVGAVVGGVIQQIQVTIHLLEAQSKRFRVHLPDGVCDFANLEAAVTHAQAVVLAQLEDQARAAGAAQIEIKMTRYDNIAPIRAEWGGQLYLGTELVFTAMGRPALS
jgi:N-methylhydantoinase A/oxoprolinase/acetone carboxylase beta subunit